MSTEPLSTVTTPSAVSLASTEDKKSPLTHKVIDLDLVATPELAQNMEFPRDTSHLDVYRSDLAKKRDYELLMARRHKYFGPYARLFSFVIFANLAGMIAFLWVNRGAEMFPLATIIDVSAANVLLAVLIRQEYIVNTLYHCCWYIPHSWPLWFRTRLTKFYEHGGLHSGAALASTIWLLLLAILSGINYQRGAYEIEPLVITCVVLVVIMLSIIIPALHYLRFRYHDLFERSHRFCGWTAVALFWLEIGLYIHQTAESESRNAGLVAAETPSFWITLVITFHIILPWISLRKMKFTPRVLSDHAIRLDFESQYPHIAGIALSESPLLEWHPFATYPRPKEGTNQHSVVISRVGDWTSKQIGQPSTYYYVKGTPKTGLLSLSMMFARVVIVTTGSGIAPVISMTLSAYPRARRTQVALVWSASDPLGTYGQQLYDDVVHEHAQAVVIDTKRDGRPNLIALAYGLYKKTDAEAVFVISNRAVTRATIEGLEEMGVPAFGPIWDS